MNKDQSTTLHKEAVINLSVELSKLLGDYLLRYKTNDEINFTYIVLTVLANFTCKSLMGLTIFKPDGIDELKHFELLHKKLVKDILSCYKLNKDNFPRD